MSSDFDGRTVPPATRDVSGHAPDPHGEAALLLAESIIHGLVAKQILTVADAVEIVAIAADVKLEIAQLGVEPSATASKSLTLLAAIQESLRKDLNADIAGTA